MHVPLNRGGFDTVAAGFSDTRRYLYRFLNFLAPDLLPWLGSRRPMTLFSMERVPLSSAGGRTALTNAFIAVGRTVAVMNRARNRSYTLRWING